MADTKNDQARLQRKLGSVVTRTLSNVNLLGLDIEEHHGPITKGQGKLFANVIADLKWLKEMFEDEQSSFALPIQTGEKETQAGEKGNHTGQKGPHAWQKRSRAWQKRTHTWQRGFKTGGNRNWTGDKRKVDNAMGMELVPSRNGPYERSLSLPNYRPNEMTGSHGFPVQFFPFGDAAPSMTEDIHSSSTEMLDANGTEGSVTRIPLQMQIKIISYGREVDIDFNNFSIGNAFISEILLSEMRELFKNFQSVPPAAMDQWSLNRCYYTACVIRSERTPWLARFEGRRACRDCARDGKPCIVRMITRDNSGTDSIGLLLPVYSDQPGGADGILPNHQIEKFWIGQSSER